MDKQRSHFEQQRGTEMVPPPRTNLVDLLQHSPARGTNDMHAMGSEATKMLSGFQIADSSAGLPPAGPHRSSDADIKASAIHAVPKTQYDEFVKAGYKVVVAENINQYDKLMNTHHATEHPDGWPKNRSWKNADVFFDPDHKTIGIMKNFIPPDAPDQTHTVPTEFAVNIPGRFKHEFGHALDAERHYAMQNASALQAIYQAEAATAKTSTDAGALGYYLQPGSNGLRETIAGLYSIEHGGGTDQPPTEAALKANFPSTLKYLQDHKF